MGDGSSDSRAFLPATPNRTRPGTADRTLAERFIDAFRLPYVAGAFLVGSILFGFVASFVSAYADPTTQGRAMAVALSPVAIVIYLLVGYAFCVPRFMMHRVARAGTSLAALHPQGSEGYRRAFVDVASIRPQLVTWSLFLGALLLALSVPAILGTGPGAIQVTGGAEFSWLDLAGTVMSLVAFAVITLALSSVVWTYWSVSMGIRRFGGAALRLRPYYEDRFLGLKPIGALALALAAAYFGFIGLFLASLLASPTSPTVADVLGMGGLLSGLVVLGLALFFLPLRRMHGLMAEAKARERDRMRDRLENLLHAPRGTGPPADAGEVLTLDLMDRKVAAMALWPVDFRILGWLSIVVLSVTAALITRMITLLLGF